MAGAAMNDTKFTPGPWEAEPGAGGYGVKDFSHWSIAQVDEPHLTLAITIGDVSELAAQEIANARLIAAAPEMYEALNEAAMGVLSDAGGGNVTLLFPVETWDKIEAALAKAVHP